MADGNAASSAGAQDNAAPTATTMCRGARGRARVARAVASADACAAAGAPDLRSAMGSQSFKYGRWGAAGQYSPKLGRERRGQGLGSSIRHNAMRQFFGFGGQKGIDNYRTTDAFSRRFHLL